jgi:hypothetical protein
MSSVTAAFAQVARRVGYFITLAADISGYTVSENTTTYNAWTAADIPIATLQSAASYNMGTGSGKILEDMGDLAVVSGQLYRKVRRVDQTATGGTFQTFWIILPGGEYPIAGRGASGYAAGTGNPAAVARLG